jgi:hypothetical protein
MIGLFILIWTSGIQAQNIQNQIKHPKQVQGNLKQELGQPANENTRFN